MLVADGIIRFFFFGTEVLITMCNIFCHENLKTSLSKERGGLL